MSDYGAAGDLGVVGLPASTGGGGSRNIISSAAAADTSGLSGAVDLPASGGGHSGGGVSAGAISGALGSLASGITDLMSRSIYKSAAKVYKEQKAVVGENVEIQRFQMGRRLNTVIGAQASEEAGAGVSSGGSGQYLAKNAVTQNAAAIGVLRINGAIQEAALQQQADAANQQAKMAGVSGIASILSAPFKLFGL